MTLAKRFEELREQSDEELVALHDKDVQHTQVGINYYLDELARRRAQRQGDAVESMTRTIVKLTVLIAAMSAVATVLTIINVILFASE